jgi:hypothetical protein
MSVTVCNIHAIKPKADLSTVHTAYHTAKADYEAAKRTYLLVGGIDATEAFQRTQYALLLAEVELMRTTDELIIHELTK